jgi:hypothetical protein
VEHHGGYGLLVMGRVLSRMIPGTLMAFNFGTYQRIFFFSSALLLKLKRVKGKRPRKITFAYASRTAVSKLAG